MERASERAGDERSNSDNSQPLFSQDSIISNEVQVLIKKPSLIILESDTDSLIENAEPIVISSDSSCGAKKQSAVIPYKVLESNSQTSTMSIELPNNDHNKMDNEKLTYDAFKVDITPAAVSSRSNKRMSVKRRNSFTVENAIKRPARRTKRYLSAEMYTGNHSNGDLNNFPKGISKLSRINDTPFVTINEGTSVNNGSSLNGSQSGVTSDSQNIVLEFCPSQAHDLSEKDDSQPSEPNVQTNAIPVLLKSDSIETIDLANCPTDHDSADFNIDSPLNNNVPNLQSIKDKHFHTAGYVSSTPASNLPYTQAMIFKSKNLHASDNDSDSTPPFMNDFASKKFSMLSKSDSSGIRTNSSISPLNGHSDGSNVSSNSNVPIFDVQVHCDDKKEFLSLLVIKADSDVGIDVSREYKKVTKRISTDHYAADISKSNSTSSINSGEILPLAPSRVSFTSSTSSSSIRIQDGTREHNFTIPQRPCRSFPQNSLTIKGLHALKNKVNEVISQLIDIYGSDDPSSSLLNSDGKKSVNSSFEYDKKALKPMENVNGNHPSTPRSSKKKVLMRHKRPPNRLKKEVLPSTTEEAHIEGEIHSPEMIGADPIKCHRPSTPLNNHFIDIHAEKSSPKKDRREHDSSNSTKIDNPQDIKSEYCEGTLVLAKWVDKSYYLGKVKEALEGNKYVIEFYDRKVKTLYEDFIIFGNSRELPILGQSVYAIIESKDNYEPSLVLNLIEDGEGNVLYNCTTDRDVTVSVKASDIYVTEDQAKSIKESCMSKSPYSAPNTPRRRVERELNLDNIIHGPRSARYRDKSRKDLSLSNVKASTSGILQKRRNKEAVTPSPKLRHESESSEGGDCNIGRAPSTALEEVGGVQPEIQKTPRKIEGVIAGALLIKGVSKQNVGKRSSKVSKFDDDSDTNKILGPIPAKGSTLFKDLHFLLTCTDMPQPQSHCGMMSDDDNPAQWTDGSGTEREEFVFAKTPFNKERLKEQLEAGGGIVYSHFEDIPKSKYSVCKLIAPRPCFTAKYIQCLSANIRAFVHIWVVSSCQNNKLADMDANALPSGWSFETNTFINWQVSPIQEKNYRINATPFKDHLIILCSDNESFIKFWRRVCTLAGGETRTINEDDPDLKGGLVVVTERDCPHEVQNKANQDNIPLVSTDWVVQSLIMGKICSPKANIKYNFNYSEAD